MNINLLNPVEDTAVGWGNKLNNKYYIGSVNYYLFEPPNVEIYNRSGEDPLTYTEIFKVLNLD